MMKVARGRLAATGEIISAQVRHTATPRIPYWESGEHLPLSRDVDCSRCEPNRTCGIGDTGVTGTAV
jgi:hypothetical protein